MEEKITTALILSFILILILGDVCEAKTSSIDEITDDVKKTIDESFMMFGTLEEIIISLDALEAVVSQGTTHGFAFGFSPREDGIYNYETNFSELGKNLCPGVIEENAKGLIIFGKSGEFGRISSGETKYGFIKVNVPENFPEGCQIRYQLRILGTTNGSYYEKGKHFDIVVKSLEEEKDKSRVVCKEKICWVAGALIVGFNINTTYDEAKQFVESKGFGIKDMLKGEKISLLVTVPEGKELKYIPLFEKNEIVEYAQPNYVSYIEDIGEKIEYKETTSILDWIKELFFKIGNWINRIF